MKRYSILALALVLTAATLVGCGCTNQNMDNTVAPTVLPTNEEIWDTTEATTRSITVPTTPATTEDGTRNTENSGLLDTENTLDSSTTATEGAIEGRARRMMPGSR